MPDLLIRAAHESDRAAIQDVTLSAYQEYAALMSAPWEDYRKGILGTLAEAKATMEAAAKAAQEEAKRKAEERVVNELGR